MSNGDGIKYSVKKGTESCHYCGGLATTVDHVVPASLGGPDSAWNFQPSCTPCNHKKSNSWPECSCEKCETAVSRFMQNPAWTDIALKVLTLRVERVDSHLEEVERQSADLEDARVRLLSARQRAQSGLDKVQNLVLTHRYPFGRVEI
jgi:hypothetical protein